MDTGFEATRRTLHETVQETELARSAVIFWMELRRKYVTMRLSQETEPTAVLIRVAAEHVNLSLAEPTAVLIRAAAEHVNLSLVEPTAVLIRAAAEHVTRTW